MNRARDALGSNARDTGHALALGVVLATLASLGLTSCSDDKSYAVVTVHMAEGELTDIAQFVAYVSNGPARESILYYPQSPRSGRDGFRLTPGESVDFSVSFASSYAGTLKVGVEARTLNEVLGYGAAEKTIDPGHKIELDVAIRQGDRAPVLGVDAGVPADVAIDTAPVSECDFVNPSACGAGRSCVVRCSGGGAPLGQCAAAGTGKDGDICRTNQDCGPGSQCFTYACGRICRKFCNGDADCPGGTCNRRVSCDGQATQQRFCSNGCDPRGEAKDICQGQLRCLLFNEVPSCDCTEPTRTGGDGVACTLTTDCLPGFMCVMMGTAPSVCRPICKRTEPATCPVGRTCVELSDPKYMVWSACVPM
jgi:hypothetical protein